MEVALPINNNINNTDYGSIDQYTPKNDEPILCQIINLINYVNFDSQKNHKQCIMCTEMLNKIKNTNNNEDIKVDGTYINDDININEDINNELIHNINSSSDEEDDTCPICLNSNSTNLVYSICTDSKRNISTKHYSCYSCITEWIKTNKDTCPVCRSEIKTLYYYHPKYISHTITLSKIEDKVKSSASINLDFVQIEKDFFTNSY